MNNKINKKNDIRLDEVILKMTQGIENGSLTIIKQDSIVIQINIHEKYIINDDFLAVG